MLEIVVKIVENKALTNGKVEESPEMEDDVIAANRAKLANKLAKKGQKEVKYVFLLEDISLNTLF